MGFTQEEAATYLGVSFKVYGQIERQNDSRSTPRWLAYAVAWTLLYGKEKPFHDDDVPERLKETRKRYGLRQIEMGVALGMSEWAVARCEKRHSSHPEILWALAWMRLYGSKLPYALASPLSKSGTRCPMCGRL